MRERIEREERLCTEGEREIREEQGSINTFHLVQTKWPQVDQPLHKIQVMPKMIIVTIVSY